MLALLNRDNSMISPKISISSNKLINAKIYKLHINAMSTKLK